MPSGSWTCNWKSETKCYLQCNNATSNDLNNLLEYYWVQNVIKTLFRYVAFLTFLF